MKKSQKMFNEIRDAGLLLEKSCAAMIRFTNLARDDYSAKVQKDLLLKYNLLADALDEAAYELISPIEMMEDETAEEIARLEKRLAELRA